MLEESAVWCFIVAVGGINVADLIIPLPIPTSIATTTLLLLVLGFL